jgi:hypothetical protein
LIVLIPTILYAEMPYQKSPFWQSTESNVNSTGLVWHDLDRDGYLDMFVSNGNDITSAIDFIYRNNNGVIPTTHTWASAVGDYSGHCSVGDIDADGYPDFFISNYIRSNWGATKSKMYKNNAGTISPTIYWQTADTMHSFSCELGDVDGDGDLDIAFAAGEGYRGIAEKQRIYFNNEGTISTTPGWLSDEASYMLDVAWGDVNDDGFLDLAFCGDDGRVWLFLNNNGVLSTMADWKSLDNNHSNTLAWGDMDGDGDLDLAVADNNQSGGAGKFKVYKNNGGTLGLTPFWQSATGGYGSAVCWYDFDRDGDKDLATGRWWGTVQIYENIGGILSTSPVWESSTSTVIEEIRVCDIDRDGVEGYCSVRPGSGIKKAFYVDNYPMHWLDSVRTDGVKLSLADYCYDLNSGWVSVGQAPVDSIEFFYQYSDKQDIGVVNWDGANLIFADTLAHAHPQVEGDADGNGMVNITDAVYLLTYIFSGGPEPDPMELGDADCNGFVNVTDAVYLINYIFSGGPAPC